MSKIMKLSVVWIEMYVICTIFGFVPTSNDLVMVVKVALALGFFIPPGMMLHHAITRDQKDVIRYMRNLCFASLGLTFFFLIMNFLSIYFTVGVGNALYYILIFISTPMICSQNWLLSLFCWACMMMVCLQEQKNGKK